MTKSVLVFVILVVFIAIAVWFVIQKTREAGRTTITPTPTATPTSTPAPEASEPVRYENGLVVQDVIIGNGKIAENGDTLSAHYVGALEDGTVFDESYGKGQPIQFVLGSGQLIPGWELGIVGMKEGGKRRLVIPPELAYGAQGAGDAIPPNATILFEIELVSVTKK